MIQSTSSGPTPPPVTNIDWSLSCSSIAAPILPPESMSSSVKTSCFTDHEFLKKKLRPFVCTKHVKNHYWLFTSDFVYLEIRSHWFVAKEFGFIGVKPHNSPPFFNFYFTTALSSLTQTISISRSQTEIYYFAPI